MVSVTEEGGSKPYQQFLVVKPQLTNDDCHPEEGAFLTVSEDIWREHMNSDGTIEDELQLRKVGHFKGVLSLLSSDCFATNHVILLIIVIMSTSLCSIPSHTLSVFPITHCSA